VLCCGWRDCGGEPSSFSDGDVSSSGSIVGASHQNRRYTIVKRDDSDVALSRKKGNPITGCESFARGIRAGSVGGVGIFPGRVMEDCSL
jgi:hypothetical protein